MQRVLNISVSFEGVTYLIFICLDVQRPKYSRSGWSCSISELAFKYQELKIKFF